MCGRADKPQVDGSGVAALGLTHALRDVFGMAQQGACFGKQQRPACRELHVPAISPKQLRADLRFQTLDLLAEGRLSDAKPCGGTSEMQLFGHRHEVFEVAQLEWL